MKRTSMNMKQMDRLEFAMYHVEKPYRMIGYLKKVKFHGIISGRDTVSLLRVQTRLKKMQRTMSTTF